VDAEENSNNDGWEDKADGQREISGRDEEAVAPGGKKHAIEDSRKDEPITGSRAETEGGGHALPGLYCL